MRAGKLDRKLTFKRLNDTHTVSPDGALSEEPTDWSIFAEARAELVSDALTMSPATYGSTSSDELVFRIRYRTDLRLGDHVHFGCRVLKLTGIRELGRRRELELRCEAVS
jgi:head-tail adaptor